MLTTNPEFTNPDFFCLFSKGCKLDLAFLVYFDLNQNLLTCRKKSEKELADLEF